MAGLLTDSLPDSFPTLTIYTRSVVKVNIKKLNRSFTAAGLSGIYTRFPFNSDSDMAI